MTPSRPDRPASQGRHVARTTHVLTAVRILAGSLFATGVVLALLHLLAPAQLERAVGEAQVAVAGTVADIAQQVAPEAYPTIRLGPLGGRREMNWCDGRFIEMETYRITGVLPVYAAHNNCGGASILSWKVGEKVKIAGSDTLYEVVDERHTKKWDNIASLRGMAGELLVQTCFFGQDKMRFLALAPAGTPER